MDADAAEVEPQQHAVIVVVGDEELVSHVAAYAVEGLALGEHVVLVLTPAHAASLAVALAEQGTDLATASAAGDVQVLDAADTLATFFDGTLDVAGARATLAAAVDTGTSGGRRLRAFGEMVNLLWDAGHAEHALTLEALWNELAQTRTFRLLCGYTTSALQAHPRLADVDGVCRLHSELTVPATYARPALADGRDVAATTAERSFVSSAESVGAARHWVEAVLLGWGEQGLVCDAMLVTSELATNAVRHASSAFRTRLVRTGTTVRLSFEDLAVDRPSLREVGHDRTGGRGVAIVEQTSDRWGLQTTPDGKVVWAEFASRATCPT